MNAVLSSSKEKLLDTANLYHFDDGFNMKSFFTFIIKNSLIPPYMQLLQDIINDQAEEILEVVHEILRYTAIACLHIKDDPEMYKKYIKSKQDIYLQDDNERKRTEILTELIESQPINCDKKNSFSIFSEKPKFRIQFSR